MGKKILLMAGVVAVLLLASLFINSKRVGDVDTSTKATEDNIVYTEAMELKSPDFEHNTLIPSQFTCDGEDINPSLEIKDVPAEAESLVLIVDDPDAPAGTWVHWLVWNIDPTIEIIPAGTAPVDATEGTTSFGRTGYGGPCPPSGTHRYFFKLYALSKKLDLSSSAKIEELEDEMADAVVASAELVGLYSRDVD